MNVLHPKFLSLVRMACFGALFALLAGCATSRKIDWDSRVGSYTHDQAILELGPPDRSATLTDGTQVVEWLTARGRVHGFTDFDDPFHYSPYRPRPIIRHYSATTSPDYFIRLTFSPDGRLQSWKQTIR